MLLGTKMSKMASIMTHPDLEQGLHGAISEDHVTPLSPGWYGAVNQLVLKREMYAPLPL